MTQTYQRDVYIIDGTRTPFLKARGGLGPFPAADLAVYAARALLLRQSFSPSDIDEVIVGCTMAQPQEANIARVIALRLGCGKQVPAWTVQRNCASGMQALDNAAQDIAQGRSDLVLAGGTEAMSYAPFLFSNRVADWLGRWFVAKTPAQRFQLLTKLRLSFLLPVYALLKGLTDPIVGLSMGQTAENLAYRFNISRQQMDKYALQSHQRLAHAMDQGFMTEVIPLYDKKGKIYKEDDGLRRDTNLEKLGKLKPFFDRKYGSVTAGNSSQVTDGASFLLLASQDAVERYHLPIRGKITDCQWAAVDPAQMGLGPVHATTPILQRHNFSLNDIDFWEINEAFAAQVLACLAAWADDNYCRQQLGLSQAMGVIDEQRLNVDGGAICIGHPIGASGARIVLHLLHVLERNHAKRGIATLCVGGGQGGAMLIERNVGVQTHA